MLDAWVDSDTRWVDRDATWQPGAVAAAVGTATGAFTVHSATAALSVAVAAGTAGMAVDTASAAASASVAAAVETAGLTWTIHPATAALACTAEVGTVTATWSAYSAQAVEEHTITVYPAANTDTGYTRSDGVFYPTGYYSDFCQIGSYLNTVVCRAWIRLALAGLPANATIKSAILTLTAVDAETAACSILIGANDAADPASPTTTSAAMALPRMSNPISWSPEAWPDATTHSIDIASVIQGVVSRSDYVAGNHALLLFDDNGSASAAYRRFATYAHASGTMKPRLVITYTAETSTGFPVNCASMSLATASASVAAAVTGTPATVTGTWTIHSATASLAATAAVGTATGSWSVQPAGAGLAVAAGVETASMTMTLQPATATVEGPSEIAVPVNGVSLTWAVHPATASLALDANAGTAGLSSAVQAATAALAMACPAGPASATLAAQPGQAALSLAASVGTATAGFAVHPATMETGDQTLVPVGTATGQWTIHPATAALSCTAAVETVTLTVVPEAAGPPRLAVAAGSVGLECTPHPVAGVTCDLVAPVAAPALRLTVGPALGQPRLDAMVDTVGLAWAVHPATCAVALSASVGTARLTLAVQPVTVGTGRFEIWSYVSPLPSGTRLRGALPQGARFPTRVTITQT